MSAAIKCPDCGRFSKESWEDMFGTQNGNIYEWGGTCSTHGEWRDST